jgi:uroporphyrin-III C-methyltransferase/precorrin-2 dehydrogenase/sirohydrochlorin ferrochelatase
MSGLVSLVGAGPGDPDLLTRKAARRLAEADLVLFDALVPVEMRTLAPGARWFFVGKRAGRPGLSQDAIQRLMVRSARRGLRVVRLKCGDPFVFGRGGEEALALSAAGIPFEVVPGVSSAVAAPAFAGIPVTHRGLSSAFVAVAGHAESAYRPVLEALPPNGVTVVVLMGTRQRREIAGLLLAWGWRALTPSAVVWSATRPDGASWRGPLARLGAAPVPADAPATLVIGEVVSLAAVLSQPVDNNSGVRSRMCNHDSSPWGEDRRGA